MDLSLAHLKKVLKFGILLVGIQFAGLQSGLGEYTPSSLKYNTLTIGNINCVYWLKTMVSNYGSEALVRQSVVPSAMLDSNGFFYTLKQMNFTEAGIMFCICKFDPQGKYISNKNLYFSPWYMVNSSINCQTTPNLSVLPDVDPTHFKNYIHNAFQACIAQEVGNYSNFLYVFCYVPPTRYMNPSNEKDDEGILMLKIKKSDLSIVSQTFHQGHDKDNHYSYHHQRPRRDSDSYAFGAECGNYQAWVDTENGTDHVHLNWIVLETKNDFSSSRVYQMYNSNVASIFWSSQSYAGGRQLASRAIKHNNYIYAANDGTDGLLILNKYSSNSLHYKAGLSWNATSISPFCYIDHYSSRDRNKHTSRNYDFCIVDNEGSPIFCVLGLRATSETDNTKTSLSGKNNERWTSKCINDPSKIVLILSNYTWNTSSDDWVERDNVVEDPQNIIYSTGKTTAESCTVDCGCYTNDKGDYEENQLFKNTHKLCTYTSESGTKYIIYCYCYPGKSKQLFLGYAPYIISNNKVQLLTKTEFKSPPTTTYPMGESFGDFTSCSRIISMDCKNGQLWITWMNADNTTYYCFHIAAKDLVGE